jgi:prevent-host-death family protein
MDKIIPISDLQSKAKKYVDQVRLTEEPVIITQRGRAAAILVDYDSYEGHLLTLDEMSYPDWRARLAQGKRESHAGKGIELHAFLKKKAGLVKKR